MRTKGKAFTGNTTVMRLLVEEYSGNVTRSDDHGCTLAHITEQTGNFEALKLLVENRADLPAETYEGYNPLYHATAFGHIPVMEYILRQNPELLASCRLFIEQLKTVKLKQLQH